MTKRTHKLAKTETIEAFLLRNGKIQDCGYHKEPDESDYDFPARPIGKHILGQDIGNLQVPRYAGT